MSNSVVNQIKIGATTYDVKPYLESATSGDNASPTGWTSVDPVANTDSYDTVFNKITNMVKNVRWLYNKIGTSDYSAISSTISEALTTLNSGKSDTTHNHNGVYSAIDHTHSEYSLTTHTHSNYSTTGHTHSQYAASDHNHDTTYATINHTHSDYSTTGHTHSGYSTTGHTHSEYSLTTHTHSYIPTSDIVTSQTNSISKVPAASLLYSMNDTLNTISSNVSTGKSSIATAITNKGVSASSSDTWAQLASKIGQLKPSSAVNMGVSTTSSSSQYVESISFSTSFKASNFVMAAQYTESSGTSKVQKVCTGLAYVNGTKYVGFARASSSSATTVTNGTFRATFGNTYIDIYMGDGTSSQYSYLIIRGSAVCVYW